MTRIMPCSICKKQREVNLTLLKKNICQECESNLVKVEADDLSYDFYKDSIKQILSPK